MCVTFKVIYCTSIVGLLYFSNFKVYILQIFTKETSVIGSST
nr:MAG TPA: hypothetical protein [Caudoviricetes sp.]